MNFKLKGKDGKARVGELRLKRGTIHTPAFMPVGTAATVKGMLPDNVRSLGADIILCNTYHLMLRPGEKIIEKLGGLHKFMNWSRPILTDRGGFQVMSLAGLAKMSDKGVDFRSHIDGKRYFLSPEYSIGIQQALGSDIIMCFDECIKSTADEFEAHKSMKRSMAWAVRSKKAFDHRREGSLFGIQQGGTFTNTREESAKILMDIGFEGYAIGGLAVGEPQHIMFSVLDNSVPLLPEEKPRYLMGVGKPGDILGAVLRGVDMFDCVLPSRSGRTGQALTRRGPVNLRNARHAKDPRPLDSDCTCPTCSHYSRAYLHHVCKLGEIISSVLLTWHNLHYYQELMGDIRSAIKGAYLGDLEGQFYSLQEEGDIPPF